MQSNYEFTQEQLKLFIDKICENNYAINFSIDKNITIIDTSDTFIELFKKHKSSLLTIDIFDLSNTIYKKCYIDISLKYTIYHIELFTLHDTNEIFKNVDSIAKEMIFLQDIDYFEVDT